MLPSPVLSLPKPLYVYSTHGRELPWRRSVEFQFQTEVLLQNCFVYPIRIPISCPTKLHLPTPTNSTLPPNILSGYFLCYLPVKSNTHSLLNLPLVGWQGEQLPSKVAYTKCVLAAVTLHSTHIIWKPNSSSQLWFKHKNHTSLYVTPDPGPTQLAVNTPTNSIIYQDWHWRAVVWWMTSAQTLILEVDIWEIKGTELLSCLGKVQSLPGDIIHFLSWIRTSQLVIPSNLQYLHTIHFNYQKRMSHTSSSGLWILSSGLS